MKPQVEIRYCPRCRWLLRAAWLAQELLTTFEEELGAVTLAPAASGVFEVLLDGAPLFSRAERGRLPEARELKQLVRDRVCPEKALGHSEKPVER
jgi:selenoprotein W-related protein